MKHNKSVVIDPKEDKAEPRTMEEPSKEPLCHTKISCLITAPRTLQLDLLVQSQ
ncbi:hypothetical protein SK128_022723, partial [Halocaridina rubra]